MSSVQPHSRLAKQCAWALMFASIMLVVSSTPVGAVSTTTITGGECDLQTGTITVTWSGKDPYTYAAEWDDLLHGRALLEDFVTKAEDKINSVTVTEEEAIDHTPITVTLFGKPHGNDFPGHGSSAPRLDRIDLTCT